MTNYSFCLYAVLKNYISDEVSTRKTHTGGCKNFCGEFKVEVYDGKGVFFLVNRIDNNLYYPVPTDLKESIDYYLLYALEDHSRLVDDYFAEDLMSCNLPPPTENSGLIFQNTNRVNTFFIFCKDLNRILDLAASVVVDPGIIHRMYTDPKRLT